MKGNFLNWVAVILSLAAFIIIVIFEQNDPIYKVALGIVALVLIYTIIKDVQKRKMK
jgi:uncharacterized membrane protein YcaP (DUF421 family)